MLWLNFILGLNFIILCLKLIIIHYHTAKQWLNSSPIDELGSWCLQSWWSRAMLQHEEEVSMATLRMAPTRQCHTEQFSGILTNQYYPGPYHRREGGRDGKNQSTKGHANSKLLQQHFVKNCKQATAYTTHEVPLLEASGHPQYSWKNCSLALLRG